MAALPRDVVEKMRDLARRIERLQPNYQDPQRYYRLRDDIADDLDQLTR